jgi:hypothetical protein
MKKGSKILLPALVILVPFSIFGQNTDPAQAPPALQVYPKTVVYTCLFLPVVAASGKSTTWNTSSGIFSIGLATGINVLFSDRFGFSFDVSPVITTTKGLSKVSNVIIDPGPVFRLKNGYSLITRIAFETAGRFGESTVLAKAFTPSKKNSLFVAVGIPIRFGNNLPATIGASLFFGIAFR